MKLGDRTLNGHHTSANDAPHRILWYDKKLSIALCVLTHTMCCLWFWRLGDSHGLASREREREREISQVSMRGWHQVLMIMVDKGKFKITILKDYMLEACGWSHDGHMKINTKKSFPHCVWGSYLKTSPMSCHSTWAKKKLQLQAQVKGSSQRY